MIEALTISEARYKGLIAHLPDSTMHLFDHDLRLLLSEGERMRVHGYDPQALEGRLLRDAVPPAAYERLAPEYRAALAGETRSFDLDSLDGTARTGCRSRRCATTSAASSAAWRSSRDITARRRAERALEQRAGELERSNAELEQFAYVASHDLSEPLRMVSSYLQLLRRRYHGKLDADADEFIDFAVDGAGRMRDLIDDLLTYSRAGRGDGPLAPVDSRRRWSSASCECLQHGRGRARGATSRSASCPPSSATAHQLGQLFQNLIGNAVKFVPEDRIPEIAVGAERDGDRWRFEVADNGIGMEPAHAERIFRMFQRLHTRDEYPGTGIGLAIARRSSSATAGRSGPSRGPRAAAASASRSRRRGRRRDRALDPARRGQRGRRAPDARGAARGRGRGRAHRRRRTASRRSRSCATRASTPAPRGPT